MHHDSPSLPAIPAATAAAAPPAGGALLGRLALLAFITGFSGAIMPGSLLAAVIEKTTRQGLIAVTGLMTGHALLEILIVALLALGLHPILGRPRVRAAIGLVGGAALLYMGLDMVRHAWGSSLNLAAQDAAADSLPLLLLQGALISLLNPYFIGWWATVGAGQIAHMAPKKPSEYLVFYLGHEAADFTWYGLVGILIITSRRWLTDAAYRTLILVCSALILALALRFLWTGWRLLRARA